MDYSLLALAPNSVARAQRLANAAAQAAMSTTASGDILDNSKAMALLLPGLGGVLLISIGWVWTIRKMKEGIGEALVFQIGLIVVGVIIVLSVGIAAAVTDWSVDQGLVNRKYYKGTEWSG